MWSVYILECDNDSYYTGITNDLGRRILQHRKGQGAKYTRAFGVRGLLWSIEVADRSVASKLEIQIKRMSRLEKEKLIAAG